jgi:hypothetical protein
LSTIKEGAVLKTNTRLKETNAEQASILLDGLPGRNLIVGVPGAFTP